MFGVQTFAQLRTGLSLKVHSKNTWLKLRFYMRTANAIANNVIL